MKNQYFLTFIKSISLILTFSFFSIQCSDQDFMDDSASATMSTMQINDTTSLSDECSGCTYVVPANTPIIDGKELGLAPGTIIGLSASIAYGKILFRNIVGTATDPIIIKNCDGVANVNGTGLSYSIKTENSSFFRITGGETKNVYGIKITGGQLGITLDYLSTNFEVDHVEIQNVGFAGVMAKTDPSCDDATIRGNFTMKKVYLHENFVHDTGGEGFYVGNSFYEKGANTPCGARLPHEIHHLKLYNNIVKNSGWEGIQVGCATKDARIYGNTIENYGTANVKNQRNGMQIGGGTGGLCYGNLIKGGTGNGLIVLGLGDNLVYNNVIENAGDIGIFCDERYTPGPGFKFINNTIINPKSDGIRIYAELVPMNVIVNNIIVNPGSYSTYVYPRTPQDAFVYKLSKEVKIEMSNNYFSTSLESVQFIDLSALNYRVESTSPIIDQGADISAYYINTDFYKKARLKGPSYDIGAVEF